MPLNIIKCMHASAKVVTHCLNQHNVWGQTRRLANVWTQLRHQKPAQNLVIDMSFEDLMTTSECRRLANDLYTIFGANSTAAKDKQFNIKMCETPENSITVEYLRHNLPQIQFNDNFNAVNQSYLDLFPNNRLVYLSSFGEDVVDFNDNDTYIIGGLVQKKFFRRDFKRVAFLKAKNEGIAVQRLPINHLVCDDMKRGIVLFLPQVFNILMDVKSGDDWESAVRRHLPEWKLRPVNRPVKQVRTLHCR